jgi:putative nucleotidyltransferase with HDIG domain
MALRIKALVCLALVGAIASLWSILGHPAQQWLHFFVYLAAILLSSGMKVVLPKVEGTMSLNFPFILLGILQLSPLQAACLAACSVLAQCRIRVIKPFTLIQILFNLANVTTATVLAWYGYVGLLRLHCEVAPALAIAAAIYFFSNTIPVAFIIASDQKTNPFAQWRRDFPWFLPFYLVGAMLAVTANLIGVTYGWMTSLLLIPMVYTIYRAYSAQMAIMRDREQHAIDTEALHFRTIEGLAMAIEAKDQGTHRHLLRVRVYVAELGKLMGLDQPLMQALVIASFLHDIGKLAVPEHIINKPGKLTHEEFEKMKIHPVVGADILERVRFPYPVVPIVRSHHEAWDGSGYPDGLKGEEIPIGARLLTVVDCFDALASERPYRKALPLKDAMGIVRRGAGTQFDPQIVDLLERHHLDLEEKARQQIDEMEPLKTDILIDRGAAPGAGFEPEHGDREAMDQGDTAQPTVAAAGSTRVPVASLDLIAKTSREAKAVSELSQMLDSSLSARDTSSTMSSLLRPLIPCDCFAVYLKSGESLLPQFIDGACFKAFSMRQMPIGEGLSGWVAENARAIVNGNPTVEPNYLSESGLFNSTSSALSIPLFDPSGGIFGALTLYAAASAAFSKDHLRILQGIESRFSLSLQNALRSSIAETDAGIDRTTQLPDTQSFEAQPALERLAPL